ncbi:MAG TPA: A/G-specific adenine glycosylase [Allosphingosinicella sp.]|jgi:A/G-specific adenine glycosylase|nr:A/G-specific adenine glycosylase [Allosphingosinicella sp.]
MPVDAAEALLCWYVVDKRRLPWRAEGGTRADPYRVWLSEVMLQQTTVAAVKPYFETFTRRWPTVEALAAAGDGEVMAAWAGLGYYARARNLLACARAVAGEHEGRFPDEEAALRKLPGIGAYTAAAIAAIAFGKRAVVVDGNVERVIARLHAMKELLPAARARVHALTDVMTPDEGAGAGDFAQAMMDLGATICTPRNPACDRCPLQAHCAAYREGTPERYPVKAPKMARPRREGAAYWLEHDGEILLVRRPASGLLGGMLALPTEAPVDAQWREAGAVDHVFTHFALTMTLMCAEAEERPEGIWWPVERIGEAGLPTLFAKLAARGLEWRSRPSPQPSSGRMSPRDIQVVPGARPTPNSPPRSGGRVRA